MSSDENLMIGFGGGGGGIDAKFADLYSRTAQAKHVAENAAAHAARNERRIDLAEQTLRRIGDLCGAEQATLAMRLEQSRELRADVARLLGRVDGVERTLLEIKASARTARIITVALWAVVVVIWKLG